MNTLQIVTHEHHSETTLEELLQALTKYGKPRLCFINKGWYCSIEMHVSAAGVDFKVASDFDLLTPTAATTQCLARTEKAVSQL